MVNLKKLDKKWQKKWEQKKLFEANPSKKKKLFVTVPYPYVNGSPHIGAGFTFMRVDVYARFKRMQGLNVLFPQGFHATGEPILGAIERLRNNDPVQMSTFKLYGATEQQIKAFAKNGPEFTAKFWRKKWIEDLKLSGFSIDWRRTFITTTMTPTYSRFVEWQYNTLKKKGYVTQGTHPVVWCSHCQSPTGDHDRLKGEGESPIEYAVIKFKLESGEILPCATLRPETVFGVTNIWVRPDVEYVWAKVDNEVWLLSEQAVDKLRDQLKKVQMIGKVKGEKLVGRFCENPVTKDRLIVLPSAFVDPEAATGVVMSVPSHAPYDWIALKELQDNPEQVKAYGIDAQSLLNIKPISVIKSPEFGEQPAIELCEKMGIKSLQEKDKLDKATDILYKKEYHTGVCKENCQQYAGMKVTECKEKLIKEFIDSGFADSMWEITAPVVCRCTTRCHVKILENQWFLKFSDPEWKAKVKDCIGRMKFYPDEARLQFLATVDWLKDKACTRRSGLGTPLPWDKSWLVETLSDSTIYMAYYTIARIINEKKIEAKKLIDEVFDYIFLGKGNSKEVAKKSKLNIKLIEEMRKEFEYFYPVDLRNSGKDLVQNHLTYFLFHHTAMWDNPKYWPQAIGVNGYVNVAGEKMSKSKGNIIPLASLVKKFGADLVRINIVASNEGLDDADWREENLPSYEARISFIVGLIKDLKKAKRNKMQTSDTYLQSVLQETIKKVTQDCEEMKFRSAVQSGFFDLTNDIKWYIERAGGIKNCNRKLLEEALTVLVKVMAPIMPHLCEELWSELGNKPFIAVSDWPQPNEKLIDRAAIEAEKNFKKLMEDITHVLKLAGDKKNLYLYFVADKELNSFADSSDYVKKHFGFKSVKAFLVSDKKKYDPQCKAGKAKFGKPGIYLE